jgi:hypothetical protein
MDCESEQNLLTSLTTVLQIFTKMIVRVGMLGRFELIQREYFVPRH